MSPGERGPSAPGAGAYWRGGAAVIPRGRCRAFSAAAIPFSGVERGSAGQERRAEAALVVRARGLECLPQSGLSPVGRSATP